MIQQVSITKNGSVVVTLLASVDLLVCGWFSSTVALLLSSASAMSSR